MDATTEKSVGLFTDSEELVTWARERTIDELRGFVNRRHSLLPDDIDVE